MQAAAIHERARRQRLLDFVESPRIERTVIALIIFNALTLGLETSPEIMASYVVELTLRIAGQRIRRESRCRASRSRCHGLRFFRDPWGAFDFLVIGVALAPAGAEYAVLRALRVVPFILIATFTMLNLFIAIIVSAMQSHAEEESVRTRAAAQASTHVVDRSVHDELTAMRQELAALRSATEAGKARVDR